MIIKLTFTGALGITTCLLLSGCPFECVEDSYAFQVNFRATPEQGVLAVGDTLWLEAQVPIRPQDVSTGQTVPYGGVDLVSSITIFEVTTDTLGIADAAHRFEFLIKEGQSRRRDDWEEERNPNRSRNYAFVENDSTYRFRGGLVAQRPGWYAIGLTGARSVYRKEGRRCHRASFAFVITNEDKHLEALQRYYYKGYPIPPSDMVGVYGFEVVE